jgi:hypothetical protein
MSEDVFFALLKIGLILRSFDNGKLVISSLIFKFLISFI